MSVIKISVIMPCFNDGKYIEKSVESVLQQDTSDWELIIVDDGSDDAETLAALDRLSKLDKIHVIQGEHRGVAVARNTGISVASGKYILPLDSDDIIESTYLRKASMILDDNPEIGIVYSKAKLFGEINEEWNLPEFSLPEMLYTNLIFVTAMFRKIDWIKVNGFDEAMIYGLEDYEFWLSVIELNRKVYRIPEILFFYRIKKISRNKMFSKSSSDKRIQTYEYISKKHYRLYAEYASEVVTIFRRKMVEREEKLNRIKRKIPFYNFLKNVILKK